MSDQPVEHVRLELGAGRAGRPEHPLHAEAGREQVAEDGGPGGCWPGSRRRSSGDCQWVMPGRMISLEVGEDRLERLALARAARRAAARGSRPA